VTRNLVYTKNLLGLKLPDEHHGAVLRSDAGKYNVPPLQHIKPHHVAYHDGICGIVFSRRLQFFLVVILNLRTES